MLIRPVAESEIPLLRDMSIKTFIDAFGDQNTVADMDMYIAESRNLTQVQKEFNNPNTTLLFTESEGEITGFMKINQSDAQTERFDRSSIELERIYLLEGHQGKGYGAKMIHYFEMMGREAAVEMIWLGVWKENPRAVSFYQSHGFEIFGEHDYLLGTDLQRDFLLRKMLL